MVDERGREVVRVLPGGEQHDQRRVGVEAREHVAALALGADEAVALVGLQRVRAPHPLAEAGDEDLLQLGLELLLDRPALGVGGLAQVGVGDQQHLVGGGAHRRAGFGEGQGQHGISLCGVRQCRARHRRLVALLVGVELQEHPVFGRVEGLRVNARDDAPARAHHRRGGGGQVGEGARGDRGEQRRAERHRVLLLDQVEVAAERVGVFLQQQRVLRPAAAEHDAVDPMPRVVHAVDDVPRAVGERLHGGEVEPRQRVGARLQRQPRHEAAGTRVRPGRAVAVVVGKDVQVAGRLRLALAQRGDPVVQHRVDAALLARRGLLRQRPRIALPQRPVEQRPGGALAALVEPHARQHGAEVRTPDPGDHDRLAACDHVAVRGAADQRQAALGTAADQREAPGVRVDDPGGDDGPGCEPEGRGRGVGQPAGRAAQRQDLLRQLGPDVVETDGGQHRSREAVLVREVVPLAGQRADARGVDAAAAPDEVVGEVEKAPRRGVAVREVPAQPEHLGQFHLDADLAADVHERRVARRVDRRGLLAGAVVHPHDDVARGIAVLGHRDRPAVGAHGDERAGGVEADRRHRVGGNAGRCDGLAHGGGRRRPDVGRRLLDEPGARVELLDRAQGEGEPPPVAVVETRAHARRADVHTQKHPFAVHRVLATCLHPTGDRRGVSPAAARRRRRASAHWLSRSLTCYIKHIFAVTRPVPLP